MENKSETATNEKATLVTSQAPTQALKREQVVDRSTNQEAETAFIATAKTAVTGKGEPLVLHTKMSLADYQSLVHERRESASSAAANSDLSAKPQVTKTETESDGKKIQTIAVTQGRTAALVNPAALKKHGDQVVAHEVDDQAGQTSLEIPVSEVWFIVNGKRAKASKLKQFLAGGESNLFKIDANSIDVVPAKGFSGEIAPVKLGVTTVNGDQHVVNYVTTIWQPTVVASAEQQKAQITLVAGDDKLPLAKANVQQVFFTKDDSNTTIVNVTANGQTVGEAQIDPATGEINLVRLTDYSGQLDDITVSIYLKYNQVIRCNYQPTFE